MSLRDVMAYLQKHHGPGAAVTPVTPSKCEGLQPEPAWTGRVPPVTPAFNDAGLTAQKSEPDEAPAPAPELLDWRALDRAYQAHHVRCPVCIAAGRGTRYGLRCGVGAALWTAYDKAVNTPGVLPWQQQHQQQQQQKGQRHD